MEPFRVGGASGKTYGRKLVAAVLSLVAVLVPFGVAASIVSGGNTRPWAGPAIWAIGAIPGLGMAALGARKPRPADVVGGYAILVGLVVLAAYVTALAINPPQ